MTRKEPPITALATEPPHTDHTHRANTIEQLLTRYHDYIDPMQARNGTGDGEPIPLMPPSYNRRIRELERLLRTMRDTHHPALLTLPTGERVSLRKCWWHVNEWHLKAETVINPRPSKQPRRKRELHRLMRTDDNKPVPTTRINRDPRARHDIARRAIEWLADNWALQHEPMLPTDKPRP